MAETNFAAQVLNTPRASPWPQPGLRLIEKSDGAVEMHR